MASQSPSASKLGRRRRLRRIGGAAVALMAASTQPALALVDVTVGSCTIVVVSPGTLTASTDLKSLASTNPGGQAARVSVTTLLNGGVPQSTCSLAVQVNCFRVTFVPPTSFAFAPAGADASVQFTGRMQPQGATALLDLLSAVVLLGTQTVDLSLSAAKTAGVFTAGTYQAQPTIRCE